MRANELLTMTKDGVNVRQRTARVERGKGGKGRVTAFSAQTARDLDRYIRARASHRLAGEPWLWLPVKRSAEPRLTYGGLYTALRRRALAADPPFRLHPHMLRSTGAIGFRRKGGQVTSLMALGGWSDIAMVQRYIRAAENELAIEEARRLFDNEPWASRDWIVTLSNVILRDRSGTQRHSGTCRPRVKHRVKPVYSQVAHSTRNCEPGTLCSHLTTLGYAGRPLYVTTSAERTSLHPPM